MFESLKEEIKVLEEIVSNLTSLEVIKDANKLEESFGIINEEASSSKSTQGDTYRKLFYHKLMVDFDATTIEELNSKEKTRFFNELQRDWDAKKNKLTPKQGKKTRRKQLTVSEKEIKRRKEMREKLKEMHLTELEKEHKRLEEGFDSKVRYDILVRETEDFLNVDIHSPELSTRKRIRFYQTFRDKFMKK